MAENKAKKISISAFQKAMKEQNKAKTVEVEWQGNTITVTPTLGLQDVIRFTKTVVDSCFDQETGEYHPEIREFVIKSCVLEMYGNFRMPENLELRYDLLYNTDAVETVLKYVNEVQYYELLDAISVKLNHMAESNISAVTKQINDIYAIFNNLASQLETSLSDVDINSVAEMLKGASSEEMVDAYMKHLRDKEASDDEDYDEDVLEEEVE